MDFFVSGTSLSKRTTDQIQEVLSGQRRGYKSALLFAGPAVIASVAYMDPGNFATNIQAGSEFGYTLLWVVLLANAIAMLYQALSAKLGIVTGRNLAELCRAEFSRPLVIFMWVASEVAAMATDLAEFVGGAIGLSLLLQLPLMAGMVMTGIITYGVLLIQGRGYRPIELVIGGLVAMIALCYLLEMFIAPISWHAVFLHSVWPRIPNEAALTITVGIVGATVMPHAIYIHSGLTQNRALFCSQSDRQTLIRFSNREVLIALGIASAVNMAMVMMAAAAFHIGHNGIVDIQSAYHTLTPLLGLGAAAIFLISLTASGISSSVVGTMAGQMIMQGFVGFRLPVWVRRAVTMAPAFLVIGLGINPTQALVISQVVLSFALPIPMIALVLFTRRRDILGEFVNKAYINWLATAGAVGILLLNIMLLLQSFGVGPSGLG